MDPGPGDQVDKAILHKNPWNENDCKKSVKLFDRHLIDKDIGWRFLIWLTKLIKFNSYKKVWNSSPGIYILWVNYISSTSCIVSMNQSYRQWLPWTIRRTYKPALKRILSGMDSQLSFEDNIRVLKMNKTKYCSIWTSTQKLK